MWTAAQMIVRAALNRESCKGNDSERYVATPMEIQVILSMVR
jgi:hypothetical protein